MPEPIRLTLALSNPTPTPSGDYEILATTKHRCKRAECGQFQYSTRGKEN